jgi:hypothetical protein
VECILPLSAGLPHPNDYGIEMSVSCHAETSHGKQLHLERTTRVRACCAVSERLPGVFDTG